MKRLVLVLALAVVCAAPAFAARKISVAQLEDLLRSLEQDKKGDAEVATALKQVELTEELTRARMNSLASSVPGPMATEQIYVLEAKSASLAPPSSDLPTAPAPDAAAGKAIQDKAREYVTKTYAQLPALSATKTTVRFQDNVEAVAASSGLNGSAKEVVTSPSFSNPASFIHYINSTEKPVSSDHGAEKAPVEKDKTPWGANRMIAIQQPDPSLAEVFRQAQASASMRFVRWEAVNGKTAAVYAFSVPRQKAKMDVRVCCFPNIEQAGSAHFVSPTLAGGGSGGVSGTFQTSTDWHEFKGSVGYHGELFIDPETGTVVRMITAAEFKPSDVVRQLETRIDYGAVALQQSAMVVPVRTIVNSIVVPNGESGTGGIATRCTLFTSEYKDYRLVK